MACPTCGIISKHMCRCVCCIFTKTCQMTRPRRAAAAAHRVSHPVSRRHPLPSRTAWLRPGSRVYNPIFSPESPNITSLRPPLPTSGTPRRKQPKKKAGPQGNRAALRGTRETVESAAALRRSSSRPALRYGAAAPRVPSAPGSYPPAGPARGSAPAGSGSGEASRLPSKMRQLPQRPRRRNLPKSGDGGAEPPWRSEGGREEGWRRRAAAPSVSPPWRRRLSTIMC